MSACECVNVILYLISKSIQQSYLKLFRQRAAKLGNEKTKIKTEKQYCFSGGESTCQLNQRQHQELRKALIPLHKQYNPDAQLLGSPYNPHSFLPMLREWPVHQTRESLEYAVALLDIGKPAMQKRAMEIIARVVSLQLQDAHKPHYGLWPKYLEESLFKILRPDPNWADFIVVQLLQVVLDHSSLLTTALREQIDTAILHAVQAIQQRNAPLEYTNIAIMGIYATLITGQTYGNVTLHHYGLKRLRKFYQHTFSQDDFSEYNSPTYAIVTLESLGRLRAQLKHPEARQLVEDLYRFSWEGIAHHFHSPTHQWSGPHSRSYSTFLKPEFLKLIDRSTSSKVTFPIQHDVSERLTSCRISLPCPTDLEHFFIGMDQPHTLRQVLTSRKPSQTLTTYLTPKFTLGTANYSDFWHQRRPLIAYWGSPQKVSYFRLRVLHEGRDCSTAQFFSLQKQGDVLAGITFAKNIDSVNPYINHSRHDINFLTRDLRIRFEFGGTVENLPLIVPKQVNLPIRVCSHGINFQIMVPYSRVGKEPSKWEIHNGPSTKALDLVLYSGKRKRLHLSDLGQAAIGIALKITEEEVPTALISVSQNNNLLDLTWEKMSLTVWKKPAQQAVLIENFSSQL